MSNEAHGKVEQRLEHIKAVAREAGVKLTHQRLEIFRELAATKEHPDADSIFRAVQHRMPTVSLDTVYRTLWLLDYLELVTTVGPRRGTVRFDANLENHHHYVCVKCGLTMDFESGELEALRIPEAAKRFGSVAGMHVEVRGTCETCRKRTRKAAHSAPPSRKGGRRAGGAHHE